MLLRKISKKYRLTTLVSQFWWPNCLETIHTLRKHIFRIFRPPSPLRKHVFSTENKQKLAFSEPSAYVIYEWSLRQENNFNFPKKIPKFLAW